MFRYASGSRRRWRRERRAIAAARSSEGACWPALSGLASRMGFKKGDCGVEELLTAAEVFGEVGLQEVAVGKIPEAA